MLRELPDVAATRAVIAESRRICAELGAAGENRRPRTTARHRRYSAAAVFAGVLTLREAIVTVHLQAESMRAACSGRRRGMAAITGLTTTLAQAIAGPAATREEPVWVTRTGAAPHGPDGAVVPGDAPPPGTRPAVRHQHRRPCRRDCRAASAVPTITAVEANRHLDR